MVNAPDTLVAMSGGVDSSVAALLMLREGHACEGVTMLLHGGSGEDHDYVDKTACTTTCPVAAGSACDAACTTISLATDVDALAAKEAAEVCAALGIRYRTWDFSGLFSQAVVAPFVAGYQRGETPNPCVDCNREVKFGALLDAAREAGFKRLATGHYARVAYDGEAGVYRLFKARDEAKDQSYFLYQLGQEELSSVSFPLGGLTKQEVRSIAAEASLPSADHAESQDICFIPDGDYLAYLREVAGLVDAPGDIVDSEGKVLGQHAGIAGYTIGQRRGLGLAAARPLYVTAIDAASNRITVGEEHELLHIKALLRDFTAPVPGEIEPVMEVEAKFRYRSPAAPARLVMFDDGRFEAQFYEPQKALTPGQSLVCYQGDQVVAGGKIDVVRG